MDLFFPNPTKPEKWPQRQDTKLFAKIDLCNTSYPAFAVARGTLTINFYAD
jgi:hypothetical protein